MGSFDAAGSCGSNPGLFIAIRGLLPELSPLFHPVYQMHLDIVWLKSMGSFDAAGSCGSNPGLFKIAIRGLLPELSPLFHPLYHMHLDIVWLKSMGSCLWFERWSIDWNGTAGNRGMYTFVWNRLVVNFGSLCVSLCAIDVARACGSSAGRLIGIGRLVVE
eukprot:scaffold308335_cov106-Attheya_sp.AAC.1